jgi:hypothetical protein
MLLDAINMNYTIDSDGDYKVTVGFEDD